MTGDVVIHTEHLGRTFGKLVAGLLSGSLALISEAGHGLLDTGARVDLVADAVMHLDPAKRDAFLAEFQNRGGRLAAMDAACGIL